MSDPCFMSTIVDSQYSPSTSADGKGYLGFIPNLYDPVRPLPVNLTPEKLLKMYKILFDEPTDEDAAPYGESAQPAPPGWFVVFHYDLRRTHEISCTLSILTGFSKL